MVSEAYQLDDVGKSLRFFLFGRAAYFITIFLAALSNHQSAGYANRLALIVRVNQFSGFIQSDFSFDVSLCHIYEIRRRLQPIYSLQSDSRLFPALRHPLLLHEARLRADEVLSRTP